jgi:hypothetical protein
MLTCHLNAQADTSSSFMQLKRKASDAVAAFTNAMRTVKQRITATAHTADIPDVTGAPDC